MPNIYATPYNVRETMGAELNQILNLSASADVVTPATQVMTGDAISPAVSASIEDAARRLARACLKANAMVDAGLRGNYSLPLATVDGVVDPDDPAFFPDIVGAAAVLVKWYLLQARPDTRNRDDREAYDEALKFLGITENGDKIGDASGSVDLVQGLGSGGPRGPKRVVVSDPELTSERRSTMSNPYWVQEF